MLPLLRSEDNASLRAELSSIQKTSKQLRLEMENALAQCKQAEERTLYYDGQLKSAQHQKVRSTIGWQVLKRVYVG